MSEHENWLTVRILRQDHPDEASYWQRFRIRREPGLNVTAVLQRIATDPKTVADELTTPVAYEANCLEEVCGSCTMLINGRSRARHSSLIDRMKRSRWALRFGDCGGRRRHLISSCFKIETNDLRRVRRFGQRHAKVVIAKIGRLQIL